jgi:micrococcal nuclease
MYEYRVEIVKVVDGDTVDVDIDLGFGVWLKKERVRLFGIDTPESRTRDLVEKKHGLAAKNFLVNEMNDADDVILATNKDAEGKFGRILGTLIGVHNNELDGEMRVNINEKMVDYHHAVAYHGQSKDDIEEEHLKNRTLLNLD